MSKKNLTIYKVDAESHLPLPYADEGIRAGFPSPAQDYMELAIDLNKELIKHPTSTFYGRVVGDSMKDEGIEEGDILVIDIGCCLCQLGRDGDLGAGKGCIAAKDLLAVQLGAQAVAGQGR